MVAAAAATAPSTLAKEPTQTAQACPARRSVFMRAARRVRHALQLNQLWVLWAQLLQQLGVFEGMLVNVVGAPARLGVRGRGEQAWRQQ